MDRIEFVKNVLYEGVLRDDNKHQIMGIDEVTWIKMGVVVVGAEFHTAV